MHNDLYLKAVLTVIAAALVINVFQTASKPSYAAEPTVMKVTLCDLSGQRCAAMLGNRDGPALHIYGHTF